MNQEIPKPLRNALARQAVGDVHPSPDVLTSFMERTLAPMESQVVTHHLAQCAECREILFLANEAAEDETVDERELVAAPSISRVPVYADLRLSEAPADVPRPRWSPRMRWAVSLAAAVVLVSTGLVLQFSRVRSQHNAAPITVASNHPAPPNPEARETAIAPNSREVPAKPSAPEALPRAMSRATTSPHAAKVPAPTTVARNAPDESAPASKANPATAAAGVSSTPAVIGGAPAFAIPAAPTQNSFAETEAAPTLQMQQGAPVMFGKAGVVMHATSGSRPHWRIGPGGHLERSVEANQWTRVLDGQPTVFRSVAVTGNDVWAGGNGGALFHSSDGGEHWSRVLLVANSNTETGAIVSIRFDDSQHGIVTSDKETRWVTTDGGVNWTTQ